jgi:hypothetical protein
LNSIKTALAQHNIIVTKINKFDHLATFSLMPPRPELPHRSPQHKLRLINPPSVQASTPNISPLFGKYKIAIGIADRHISFELGLVCCWCNGATPSSA